MSSAEHTHLHDFSGEPFSAFSFINDSLTRRQLFATATGFGLTTGLLLDRTNQIRRTEAYSEHLKIVERSGFPQTYISDERKDELLGESGLVKIDSVHTRFPNTTVNPEDGIEDINFSLSESMPVIVDVKGLTDRNISLMILEGELNGVSYQLPNLQDEHNHSTKVTLGKLSEGDHVIRIKKSEATDAFSEKYLGIDLYAPLGEPLYETIIENVPLIGMRKDNFLNGTVANDMPLFSDIKMREREDGLLMIEYWQGYSKEEGGIGADIKAMIKKFDRAYDYDISLILLVSPDGSVSHRYFQTTGHTYETLGTIESYGSLPASPMLHAIGKNGMLGRGLDEDIDGGIIPKVFGTFPDLYPNKKTKERESQEVALRVNALRQYDSYYTRKIMLGIDQSVDIFPGNGAILEFYREQREFVRGELEKMGYPMNSSSQV